MSGDVFSTVHYDKAGLFFELLSQQAGYDGSLDFLKHDSGAFLSTEAFVTEAPSLLDLAPDLFDGWLNEKPDADPPRRLQEFSGGSVTQLAEVKKIFIDDHSLLECGDFLERPEYEVDNCDKNLPLLKRLGAVQDDRFIAMGFEFVRIFDSELATVHTSFELE